MKKTIWDSECRDSQNVKTKNIESLKCNYIFESFVHWFIKNLSNFISYLLLILSKYHISVCRFLRCWWLILEKKERSFKCHLHIEIIIKRITSKLSTGQACTFPFSHLAISYYFGNFCTCISFFHRTRFSLILEGNKLWKETLWLTCH